MHKVIWHRALVAMAFAVALFAVTPAWAGELLVGAEPLEVDGKGKVTKAGRQAAVTEIESLPGEQTWVVHLWGRIDKGALGPLYVEFYRDYKGKQLMAHRDEYAEYAGEKFVSHTVEIGRGDGFRPGETVEVAFVQAIGNRDVKQAKTKVTLKESSQPAPEPEAEAEPEEEEEEDEDEDELEGEEDGDEALPESEPAPETGAPPPVESGDKKGCSVGGAVPRSVGASLLTLVLVARRRRLR